MKVAHYLWRTRNLMISVGPDWKPVKLRIIVVDGAKIQVELFDKESGNVILAEGFTLEKIKA